MKHTVYVNGKAYVVDTAQLTGNMLAQRDPDILASAPQHFKDAAWLIMRYELQKIRDRHR
jgi:hypothetical protein